MYSYLLVTLFSLLLSVAQIRCSLCHDPSSNPDSYAPPASNSTSTSSQPSSTPAAPTPVATSSSSSTGSTLESTTNGPFTGGIATYFYQKGNPGACGQVHGDNDLICAMDQTRFEASSLCGQKVKITNTANEYTVTVIVADDCPTCDGPNSIDLSVGAFEALSNNDLSLGVLDISWEFTT